MFSLFANHTKQDHDNSASSDVEGGCGEGTGGRMGFRRSWLIPFGNIGRSGPHEAQGTAGKAGCQQAVGSARVVAQTRTSREEGTEDR